mgnify:CR=1 FL=1
MGIVDITGIAESRTAPVCADIINENGGQTLITAPTYTRASRAASDLSFFVNKRIYVLPSDDEKLITYEAKNRDTMLERLKIMKALSSGEDCIVVAPATAVIKHLPPVSVWNRAGIEVAAGSDLDLRSVMTSLIDMGYERLPMVYAKGQFSMRGDIIDVFTPYAESPFRIELFDTEVESIRTFDPDTQRSINDLNKISIFPAQLIIRDQKAFSRAEKKIRTLYRSLDERREALLDDIENLTNIQNLEIYMDYFYDKTDRLWDYMTGGTVIVDDPNRVYELLEGHDREIKTDFEVYLEKGHFVGSDLKNFPDKKDFLKIYDLSEVRLLSPMPNRIKGADKLDEVKNIVSRQVLSYNGKMDLLERDLERYVKNGYKVTIVCSSDERVRNMEDFLDRADLRTRIWVRQGILSSGMEFPEKKICYITDGDIFGDYKYKRRRRRTSRGGEPIKSFSDITKGDYVVHEAHGIGKFIGLKQLTVQGEHKDYLQIKYAGNDMLYVPVEQMDIIQKYVGSEGTAPKISKLNGKEWRTTKARAKASIANMAEELLQISAERQNNPGYSFGPDTVWQKEFEEDFPYEETPDQLRCIEEIKRDMESTKVMDRLLCGDVGYGKTEVAARAMFKCAAEGKQAAVLVPTTILASQHYATLKERFEKFPFTVQMMSRFRTDKEIEATIAGLKDGSVDVVIGTHRLLSGDVRFKDLGLLVIDEEQRFGVQHKEAIKKLRANVDVLTLSATPIPRTLHMSLLGIRDMSLIAEPPDDRYPVQTYVVEEDDYIIAEAIERELDRGGQVFVVYNRVNGVYKIAEKIDRLVPGKRIAVGHGRMNESKLEDVMMGFVAGEYDILVATTIIENGIDIPNANTVIIIDADKFGLSQLYQIRGRVGRTNRLAYAYLLHKKDKVLSEVAEKRLRAIKDFTEFGAGFKIAMRDLEIRGAGNILGTEQSGHIVSVGYELYCKLVDDAVKALKGEVVTDEREEPQLDIRASALIPDRYIGDELTKLSMYKKIAAVRTEADANDMIEELTDRFGDVPAETKNLIKAARIKYIAEEQKIKKIIQRDKRIMFDYGKTSGIKPVSVFLTGEKDNLSEILEILDLMAQR